MNALEITATLVTTPDWRDAEALLNSLPRRTVLAVAAELSVSDGSRMSKRIGIASILSDQYGVNTRFVRRATP